MTPNRLQSWTSAALAAALLTAAASVGQAPKLDFNFDVRPILSDKCFFCHGPDAAARKAKLRLDTVEGATAALRGGKARAVVAGRPKESELVRRIHCTEADEKMPPPASNLTLSKEEIDKLERWVAEGAEYRPHWSFIPLPDRVAAPTVSDEKWPANPIDRFVLARLDREKLRPSPPASKEAWLRRASFDLTGLPPSPAEVDAFLSDSSAEAFGKAADRLLASPHFGERMAVDWLDVARYADSFGYQADGEMQVWPWRDWVVDAFNRNLPYDRFLTWQIAGDLVPNATRESRLATAFNRLHRMTNEGGSVPEEFRQESVSDRVHTFGTAMLGLTFECCRCHDHKYDPLTMRDYYSLGAYFNSIDEWGTYDSAGFKPTPTLTLPNAEQERRVARLEKEVAAAESHLKATIAKREPALREWLAGRNRTAGPSGEIGRFSFDRIESDNQLANAVSKATGATSPANRLVPGRSGNALKFTGDDPATFDKLPIHLERGQPFTVSFWLQVPARKKDGMVFHRTSGTDTGFHGTEFKFDDGRLLFAFIRFWPGDVAAVRTEAEFPIGRWVHVSVGNDGSGRAAGLRIHIDGKPAATTVVRDSLTKDVQGGAAGLTLGERFRSVGLKNGAVDELRVFERFLTDVEVAELAAEGSLKKVLDAGDDKTLRPYFFAVDPSCASAAAALQQSRKRLFSAQTEVFEILAMRETPKPRQAYVLKRGAYDSPLDHPVGRATPASMPAQPKGASADRLGLANWLVDSRHPLTARVAANRIWQQFFGRGLVATQENFGLQGTLPTHPELLDWLARDFIDSGWDVKRFCRQIVSSSTYRQESALRADLKDRDRENLLYARGPVKRLSAEALRDAALAAGALLSPRIGGPPAKPYAPAGLWHENNSFLPNYVADHGEGLYRRSMYTFWRRTAPPPNMIAFDAPSREYCLMRRQATSTPLQPLVLMNDPQWVEAARALGERMLREGGRSVEDRLAYGFRWATGRRPEPTELRLLVDLHADQRTRFQKDPKSAERYLRHGERPPPAGVSAPELAAAAATANAMLNLDAATTLR